MAAAQNPRVRSYSSESFSPTDDDIDLSVEIAVDNGDFGLIKILSKHYPEKFRDNVWAERCLDRAVTAGDFEFMKFALKFGANPTASFHDAIRSGNIDIIRFLLNRGADVHDDKEFALRYAVREDNKPMIKLLLKYGAKHGVGEPLTPTPCRRCSIASSD